MSAAPKPLPSSKENSATGHSRPLNSHSRTVNGATTAGQTTPNVPTATADQMRMAEYLLTGTEPTPTDIKTLIQDVVSCVSASQHLKQNELDRLQEVTPDLLAEHKFDVGETTRYILDHTDLLKLNHDAPQLSWQVAGKHRTKGAQLSGVEGDYESSVERERAQNSQSSSKPQGGGRRGGGGGGAPRTGSNSGGAQGDGGIGERRGGRSRGLRVNGGTAPGGNGDGGANGGPATTSASVQSSKRDQRERQPRSARTGRPVGEKPAEPTQLGKRPSSTNQSQQNSDAPVNGTGDEDSQVVRAAKAPRETKFPVGENASRLPQAIQSGAQKLPDSLPTEPSSVESTSAKQTVPASAIPSLLECNVTPPTNFPSGVQPAAFSMGSSAGEGSGAAAGGGARKKRIAPRGERQRQSGSPHDVSATNNVAASGAELTFAPVGAQATSAAQSQPAMAQSKLNSASAKSTSRAQAASGTGGRSATKKPGQVSYAQIASKNLSAPQPLPQVQSQAPAQPATQTTAPTPNPPSFSAPAASTTTTGQSSVAQPPVAQPSVAEHLPAPATQPLISPATQQHSASAITTVPEVVQPLPKRSDKFSSKQTGVLTSTLPANEDLLNVSHNSNNSEDITIMSMKVDQQALALSDISSPLKPTPTSLVVSNEDAQIDLWEQPGSRFGAQAPRNEQIAGDLADPFANMGQFSSVELGENDLTVASSSATRLAFGAPPASSAPWTQPRPPETRTGPTGVFGEGTQSDATVVINPRRGSSRARFAGSTSGTRGAYRGGSGRTDWQDRGVTLTTTNYGGIAANPPDQTSRARERNKALSGSEQAEPQAFVDRSLKKEPIPQPRPILEAQSKLFIHSAGPIRPPPAAAANVAISGVTTGPSSDSALAAASSSLLDVGQVGLQAAGFPPGLDVVQSSTAGFPFVSDTTFNPIGHPHSNEPAAPPGLADQHLIYNTDSSQTEMLPPAPVEMPQIGSLNPLMSDSFSFGFSSSDERFAQGSSSVGQLHNLGSFNSLIYQSSAHANTTQRFATSGNQTAMKGADQTAMKGADQTTALFQPKASTGIDQLHAASGAHSSQSARSSAFSVSTPQASSQPAASVAPLTNPYAPAVPMAAAEQQQQLPQLFASVQHQHQHHQQQQQHQQQSGTGGSGAPVSSQPQPISESPLRPTSGTPRNKPVTQSGAELLTQFAALGLVEPPRSAPSAPPLPHHAPALMQPERANPARPATAAGAVDQLHSYNPNEFFALLSTSQPQSQLMQAQQQFSAQASFAQQPQNLQAGLGAARAVDVHAAAFMPSTVSAAGGVASGLAPAGQPSSAAAQALKAGTGTGQAVVTMQVNTLFEMAKSQPTGMHHAGAPQFAQAHAHTAASSGNAQSMWPPPQIPNASASAAASGAHLGTGAVVSTLPSASAIALGAQQQQQQQQNQVEPKIAGNEKNVNEFLEQLVATMSQLNLKPEELKKLIDSAVNVLPAYQSPEEQHAASSAISAAPSFSQQQQAAQLSASLGLRPLNETVAGPVRSLESRATSGAPVGRQQHQLQSVADASQLFTPQQPPVKQQFRLPAVAPATAPQAPPLVSSSATSAAHLTLQAQLQSTGLAPSASGASRTMGTGAGAGAGAVYPEVSRHMGLGDVLSSAPSSQVAAHMPPMSTVSGQAPFSEHAKPAAPLALQQRQQQMAAPAKQLQQQYHQQQQQMTAAQSNLNLNQAAALAMFSNRTTGMDSQLAMNKQQPGAMSQAVPVAANTFGSFLNPNPLTSFPFALQTQPPPPNAPPNPYLSGTLYQYNQTAAAQQPSNRYGGIGVSGQPFQMTASAMQLQPAGQAVLAAAMPMAAMQPLGVPQDKMGLMNKPQQFTGVAQMQQQQQPQRAQVQMTTAPQMRPPPRPSQPPSMPSAPQSNKQVGPRLT